MLKHFSAQKITPDSFRPFGQLILPSVDGKPYDGNDAQLNLENGVPRFYIMRLTDRGRRFSRITRHQQCTQCLGSLGGEEWFIAVAAPSTSPQLEDIVAFRIPGDCFIKLEMGTWHAGPYFNASFIDFYNLELSDTNITDHETCNLLDRYDVECEIVD